MKAIHSFKSAKIRPMLQSIGGPAALKPLVSIMALSAASISKHFENFVLITDDAGKEMAEACALPYKEIVSVGPEFKAIPDYWIESKIHAYAETNEPFIHFDTDLFLWEPLPEEYLKAEVFAFHSETFAWPLYEQYLATWSEIVPNLPPLHKEHFTNRMPVNMAIFGGNNWRAINEYAKFIQRFVADNNGFKDLTPEAAHNVDKSIAAIEQLWGSYLIQDVAKIPIQMLLTESQISSTTKVPGIALTHLHGLKQRLDKEGKTGELLQKLSAKLKDINPDVYNAVERYTSSEVDIDALLKESMAYGTNS